MQDTIGHAAKSQERDVLAEQSSHKISTKIALTRNGSKRNDTEFMNLAHETISTSSPSATAIYDRSRIFIADQSEAHEAVTKKSLEGRKEDQMDEYYAFGQGSDTLVPPYSANMYLNAATETQGVVGNKAKSALLYGARKSVEQKNEAHMVSNHDQAAIDRTASQSASNKLKSSPSRQDFPLYSIEVLPTSDIQKETVIHASDVDIAALTAKRMREDTRERRASYDGYKDLPMYEQLAGSKTPYTTNHVSGELQKRGLLPAIEVRTTPFPIESRQNQSMRSEDMETPQCDSEHRGGKSSEDLYRSSLPIYHVRHTSLTSELTGADHARE